MDTSDADDAATRDHSLAATEAANTGKIAYRNWWITYDPPPIPVRCCDWQFWHEDYDGAPTYGDEGPADNRCGYAGSLEAAKVEIDEWEEDHGLV